MTLAVETADFADAARILDTQVAGGMTASLVGLAIGLGAVGGGMAGTDPAGAAWADGYDLAAAQALWSATDLGAAATSVAVLFAATARNYERADEASGGVPVSVAGLPAARSAPTSCPPSWSVPSAAGGSGSPPVAWRLVEDAVAYVWPNGHQDRLCSAASVWRAAAGHVRDLVNEVASAQIRFDVDRLPEAADVTTVCLGLQSHLTETAAVLDAVGGSCTELAHHIDVAHAGVESALSDLAWQTGVTQVVGGIVSFFTAGAAEAPTQAFEATRIAAAARAVEVVLAAFEAAAAAVAARFAAIAERIAKLSAVAARLIEMSPRLADTVVARLLDDTGAISWGRLVRDSEDVTDSTEHVNIVSRDRTIHILNGDKYGGGHAWPGAPGKTPFPKSWSRGKIMHEISDVATDPASRIGAKYGGRMDVYGTRDGVDIKVVVDVRNDDIITAHPTNLRRNSR